MCNILFLPSGNIVQGHAGDTLLDAALDQNFFLEHECGGNCACTTCHVWVTEGETLFSPMEEVEAERLATSDQRRLHSRLACQAILRGGPVTVVVVDEADNSVL